MNPSLQIEEKSSGSLKSIFPCSSSKILDHMVAMSEFDYSISDISNIAGVGFKTTLNVVHKLEEHGVLKRTRQVGNAILYKMNPDSAQAKLITSLAFEIAKKRNREITKTENADTVKKNDRFVLTAGKAEIYSTSKPNVRARKNRHSKKGMMISPPHNTS